MYDPAIARFTGVDPIADQFAWASVYNYAENEPVRHIDLHGLQKFDISSNDPNLRNLSSEDRKIFYGRLEMQSIDKPSDMASGKMVGNAIVGMGTVLAGPFKLAGKGALALLNSIPGEGSQDAEAFHESGEQPGGIEQFSNEGRNGEGTAPTNRATEGATGILEQGDIATSETGIGVGSVLNTKAASALYNAGKSLNVIDNLSGNGTNTKTPDTLIICDYCGSKEFPYRDRANHSNVRDTLIIKN